MKTKIKNPVWKNLFEEERRDWNSWSYACDECYGGIKKGEKILISNQHRYHVFCFYKKFIRQLKNKETVDKGQLRQIETMKKWHEKRQTKIKKLNEFKEIFINRYPETVLEVL